MTPPACPHVTAGKGLRGVAQTEEFVGGGKGSALMAAAPSFRLVNWNPFDYHLSANNRVYSLISKES